MGFWHEKLTIEQPSPKSEFMEFDCNLLHNYACQMPAQSN